MMKQIFMLLAIVPLMINAQTDNQSTRTAGDNNEKIVPAANNGILWTSGLSWKEVVKKARKENKFIFLDVFATWCGPCKLMDKEVYTAPKVGEFFNQKFISVRVQMDKTKKDDEDVRKWYSDADALSKKFGIAAFPSYLFFSPYGNLVYRETGYKRVNDFLGIAQKTINHSDYPYRRYYELVAAYKKGKKDYELMPALIDTAIRLHQSDIANALEKDYRNYLSGLKETELYTKNKIVAIASLLKSSDDPFFYLFTQHSNKIDSAVGLRGYASHIVDNMIQKDVIEAAFNSTKKDVSYQPNWESIGKTIANIYGVGYVERNILMGEMKWHEKNHEWADTAKKLTLFAKQYGFANNDRQGDLMLNSTIWNAIFKRSAEKEQIDVAIECMKELINRVNERKTPPFVYLDTYANLLYKAGRVSEAIHQEELGWQKAVEWKQPEGFIKQYMATIEKMKQGQPTWPHYIDKDDIF
jgi:thioredoxin-related protein